MKRILFSCLAVAAASVGFLLLHALYGLVRLGNPYQHIYPWLASGFHCLDFLAVAVLSVAVRLRPLWGGILAASARLAMISYITYERNQRNDPLPIGMYFYREIPLLFVYGLPVALVCWAGHRVGWKFESFQKLKESLTA